jgi:hypothetical protein
MMFRWRTPAENAYLIVLSVVLAFLGWGGFAYMIIREWLAWVAYGGMFGSLVAYCVVRSNELTAWANLEAEKMRQELIITQAEEKEKRRKDDLGDLIEMPERDNQYQSDTVNHWARMDLVYACGDVDAVNLFVGDVGRSKELRVLYWKAFRGVGRENFQHIRAELIRCGLVDNGGYKGAYQWTDEGRRWLATLPH